MTPDKLRQWRKARGLTQNNLAALLGLSRSAYIYLEKGDPRRKDKSLTIPRTAELALMGLDSEVIAAYGPTTLEGLRHAYSELTADIALQQQEEAAKAQDAQRRP
jgi:transcriptional regulator with XRE-family HTH domain